MPSTAGELTEANVQKWLDNHPEEARRLLNKAATSIPAAAAGSGGEPSSLDMPRALFDIAKMLNSSLDLKSIVHKVLHVSISLIKAEKCSLFLLDKETNELYDVAFDLDSKTDGMAGQMHIRIPVGQGIIGNVAKTRIGRNIEDAYKEPLFNKDVDVKTGFRTRSMLCLPIFAQMDLAGSQDLMGVACLINKKQKSLQAADAPLTAFTEMEIEVFKDLLILVGTAIKNAKLYEQSSKYANENRELFEKARLESEKGKILLEVARLTSSASGVESLIQNILDCAKRFVHAEVSSLFLIDTKKKELYSSIFENSGEQVKISFPMSSGVAGSVASSGIVANLTNAYNDPRFNPEFDRKNNFKTVSMLSVPIFGPDGNIVGVTNLINKLDANGVVSIFNKDDQALFEAIAVFCGLALHKTMLIEETQNQQQRLTIVMELIGFHARTKPDEIEAFLSKECDYFETKVALSNWQYDPHRFLNTDDSLVAISHQMFTSLGFDAEFDISDFKLVDYLLTVRRNYRPIAYHNFTHAVSVTNGLFVLIVNGILDQYMTKLEMFSMLVACLNHDIDHRGTNNAFQQKTHSVLASFYNTSTMERHHINHTMMILNSNNNAINILENMGTNDYKKSLEIIESSILATDLALFFGKKKRVAELTVGTGGGFNKSNPDHLLLLRGIIMTCCDLTAMYKPFAAARHTADGVYEEFFQQGDEEARLGIPFTSELTDRSKTSEIPRMQVGFYNFVVIPAFESLYSLLGEPVKELLEGCQTNKKEWERLQGSGMPYKHYPPPTIKAPGSPKSASGGGSAFGSGKL